MKLTEIEVGSLLVELERLEVLVRARIKQLRDDLGLARKYSSAIHQGRIIHGEVQRAIQDLKAEQLEKALDQVWVLAQKGLKIKSVSFPRDHKTFSQLRKESIRKNPEQLIKRSKSHGEGYRK